MCRDLDRKADFKHINIKCLQITNIAGHLSVGIWMINDQLYRWSTCGVTGLVGLEFMLTINTSH